MMRCRPAYFAVSVLVVVLSACPAPPSDRELVVAAGLKATEGDFAAAEALYADALRTGGEVPEVLIRYAAFRIDTGNLVGALDLLERAKNLEMTLAEQRRLDAERVRWLQAQLVLLEAAYEPGTDPAPLRDALIELATLEPAGDAPERWARLVLTEVRSALQCDPGAPCDPRAIPATLATSAASRALRWCDALELAEIPRPAFSEAERNELRAVRAVLERVVFDAGFAAAFEAQKAAPMEAGGSWDSATREFVVRYRGPFGEGTSAESRPELILASAQSVVARQLVTQLAWELRGQAPTDDVALSVTPRDLVTVRAVDLAVTVSGELSFALHVPWDVAVRASWLLEQRVGRGAEPAATEGSAP